MSPVFTPLNEQGQRLRFDMASVEVLAGTLDTRRLGYKATVKIDGTTYDVFGKACGLPACQCDAVIREVAQ